MRTAVPALARIWRVVRFRPTARTFLEKNSNHGYQNPNRDTESQESSFFVLRHFFFFCRVRFSPVGLSSEERVRVGFELFHDSGDQEKEKFPKIVAKNLAA